MLRAPVRVGRDRCRRLGGRVGGGLGSVSYTHLDVYKRQAVELARGIDWEQLGASHGGLVTGLRVMIGDLSRALGASALQG